ncbi:chromate transporter [Methylocella tundrae]|uniref:Chromate transporter n=1 Tax=Methylocella tundrae TaxID=227605 RepID=A0A4U8YX52_METTU|nr:chromate transporter [Methylocella tundrae]WPP05573.1 chromate transporter [Methylocella tundrae]VFU08015.1 Chromate transporter [Methylocella tundrae]
MEDLAAEQPRGVSHRELFAAFFKIGICGFGGVAGWVRPIIVDERGWLNDREFAELLGASSVLPGANTVNLAVMLGDRFQGASGAATALVALLLAPLVILIGIASLYDHFAMRPEVRSALAGAAAATAGLVLGNAYKLIKALRGDVLALAIAAFTFASAGFFHLSLLVTLAITVPASVVLFVLYGRRS